MNFAGLVLIGICIGIANIIPGVSGGTLAVVFNIYDRFINCITLNIKKLWANKWFIIPLGLGMVLGILLFSKFITFLYSNYPVPTNCFFSGLIAGSVPMLLAFTLSKKEGEKFSAGKIAVLILCALAGLALILYFASLQTAAPSKESTETVLPAITFRLELKLVLAGALAALAMLIPGISGSLLMLILGVYPVIISSIVLLLKPDTALHSLFILIPCGTGIIAGLLLGAKLIGWLLKTIPNQTYAVILGLLAGSAITVLPWNEAFSSAGTAAVSIVCFICGGALAYFSGKFSSEKTENTEVKTEEKNESL